MKVTHTVDVSEAEIARAIEKYVRSKTMGPENWDYHVTIRWSVRNAIVEASPKIPTLTEEVPHADAG